MPSIADVYVTILPETSRVADGIRRALRSVDDDFYRAGKRAGREFKRGMGEVGLDVDADTAKARKQIRDLDRDIDKKHKIKVEIDHDKSSFAALATAARTVEQNFQTLAITTAAIPNTIASVGSAAASLSGVIGLLPAGVGAAALAFGSLKVATLGFGDAMKNIRDVDKFNESVKQMAPNMQQLAGAVRTALPEIDRLKFTVQDAFGAGLGEQFTKLSSTYLPMFQGAMSQMAASANTALKTVSEMMQQPAMVGDMSTMTGNMTSAFNVLSQALAPVVKSFMDIGVVGSGFLPALAQAATQAANAFAVFIQNAKETGALQGWIQTGIDAFKQLMDIAGNVGGIIGGIMKAAPPGGGLFGTLAQLTQMLSDFVNSPAGQGAFNTFMTSMQAAMSALMPAVGSLLQALAPVLGYLGQFAAVLITSLAPALQTWFEAMTPVIQQIVAGLQPVLAALAPVLQQVAGQLAQQMVTGIQQILPLLGPLIQQFGQLMIALLPLFPSLMQLATSALPAFQQAAALVLPLLTQMLQFLTQLANIVVPMVSSQVGALASSFTLQWSTISGAVKTAVDLILPLLQRLADKIQQIMDGPIGRLLGALAGPVPRAIAAIAGQPTTANTGGPAPVALPGLPLPGQQTLGGVPAAAGSRGRVPGRKAGTAPQTSMFNTSGGIPAAPMPPVSSYVAPAVSSGGGGGGGGGGTTPSAVSPTGTDWEKVAQGESQGNWAINTGNGYYGGLQFDLATWKEFGGTEFAERPDLASKEQQIAVAERVPVAQRPNRWPNTYSAGAVGRPPAGTTPAAATPGGYSSAAAATTSGSTGGYPSSGGFSDAALLANVPAGRYDSSGDLAQGLGDCSSAVEDLVNMLQGNPTAGRGMSTANAAEWLTAHGFQQGNMPGAFNVGFNSHHMQATLPGGTPFNWGSNAAAARGGVGGTGAGDPSFTDHYYMPVSGNTGALPGDYPTGDYSSYKSDREAQQKVDDAALRVQSEQDKLNKLRMKPGATPADIEKQERALAKAKREHADATEDLANAQNKYNEASSKSSGGESLGQGIMSGIMEMFGLDGTLFKDPTQFGLFKIFKGIMGLKPAGGDGASADAGIGSLFPGGGGGGGLSSLLNIPAAFGNHEFGSPADAPGPGQFMPNMPTDAGVSPFGQTGPVGAAGPGNGQPPIDNSINIVNPVGQQHLSGMMETARAEQYPRMRQPLRNLPSNG